MRKPLMPKATAIWLVENTGLTFKQIADFTGLHILEIQAIADEEVASTMQGLNPILAGELAKEEIKKAESDPNYILKINDMKDSIVHAATQKSKYTPLSRRQDKPDAIAWLIKNYPQLSDLQITKLIGTTKKTITAIREKTHWNSTNIKARNPVALNLCKAEDLEKAVLVADQKAKLEKN